MKKRVLKESDEKIVEIRNKSLKRKKKRRVMFGVLLLFIVVVLILLVSPVFNIEGIYSEGAVEVSNQQLLDASHISYGENIFKINIKQMKVDINKNIPYVQSVKIRRSFFPSVVVFEVVERKPVAALQAGEGYMLIDVEGRILERTENTQLPVITGISPTLQEGVYIGEQYPDFTEDFKQIYEALIKNEFYNVTEFVVEENGEINLILDGTKKVILGEKDDLDYSINFLKNMINELPPAQKGTIKMITKDKWVFSKEE